MTSELLLPQDTSPSENYLQIATNQGRVSLQKTGRGNEHTLVHPFRFSFFHVHMYLFHNGLSSVQLASTTSPWAIPKLGSHTANRKATEKRVTCCGCCGHPLWRPATILARNAMCAAFACSECQRAKKNLRFPLISSATRATPARCTCGCVRATLTLT